MSTYRSRYDKASNTLYIDPDSSVLWDLYSECELGPIEIAEMLGIDLLQYPDDVEIDLEAME